ncbi:MAG TPA: tRNA (guanosine(37)-N1)-methyltransferase TrmD [Clostridiales bacterium]|jgi:tRNA (guanine37-N1)-methyltransferase|nr:tRNA (guanosine(37)-N1)-methyltransferase TrmD [Clostridiales bacterium]
MKIDVLTLFPEMFRSVLEHSMLKRAQDAGLLRVQLTDVRDYTLDRHNRTDFPPFGGGAGMVMGPEPVFRALRAINAKGCRIIYMSPKGRRLEPDLVKELAAEPELVILCGHYEGIDQRVIDYWKMEEISIGDYILTGGELPAMVLIDSLARLQPGVLGSEASHDEESVYSGLLEYPHYTRPRCFEELAVPEVLLSGDHAAIRRWRLIEALRLTRSRRPDLWQAFLEQADQLDKDDRKILAAVVAETDGPAEDGTDL